MSKKRLSITLVISTALTLSVIANQAQAIPERSRIQIKTLEDTSFNSKRNSITRSLRGAKSDEAISKKEKPSKETATAAVAAVSTASSTATSTSTSTTTSTITGTMTSLSASSSAGTTPSNVQVSQVNVEPFTGSANLSIPIQVPPGRAGIQPNLALTYSSSNRQLGLAGVGWTLDLGGIQRSTKKGVPKYDTTDAFILMQGSAQDLIFDTTTNSYRTEIEGGFAKTEKTNDGWLVTDKKGTKYYFGYTDDSRQWDPANTSKIFRWALNRVEDINGNYMTITYIRDNGQIYPRAIVYTGNNNVDNPVSPSSVIYIEYANASRPSTSYIQGFKVITTKRLDYIDVRAVMYRQAQYKLMYKKSVDSDRDLLESVQQFNRDLTQSLPAVTFNYSQVGSRGDKTFQKVTDYAIPPDAQFFREIQDAVFRDNGVRIVDMNADGYPDLIRDVRACDDTPTVQTFLHNKNKGYVSSNNWRFGLFIKGYVRTCPNYDYDYGLRHGDINGDGYTDVMDAFRLSPANGGGINTGVFINDKVSTVNLDRGWEFPNDVAIVNMIGDNSSYYIENSGTDFNDINGDGFMDIILAKNDNQTHHKAYLNKKGNNAALIGWQEAASYATPTEIDFSKGAAVVDLNTDGLNDIIFITPSLKYVYMNNGSTWVKDTASPWLSGLDNRCNMTSNATLADMNGDGLVDVVCWANAQLPSNPAVWFNTGNGWMQNSNWVLNEFYFGLTRVLDINGDGLNDYLTFNSVNPRLYLSPGREVTQASFVDDTSGPSDMLVKIDNGIGAATKITYKSSLKYQNIFLPFALQTVDSVTTTVANPVGSPFNYVTRYEYANGKWDANYREFQGFGTVKVIDPDGNYTMTTFMQDHWLKGRPQEQTTYAANGTLFSKTVNLWQTQDIATSVIASETKQSKFVYLARTDNYLYDGATTPKRTAQEFTYAQSPQYGDPTQVISFGEVDASTGADIGNDKTTTVTEYVSSTTNNVYGLPKTVYMLDSTASVVSQVWFNYDGSASNNVAPTLGRLTRKTNWAGGDGRNLKNPFTSYAYDEYGNLISTTDPLGRTTTIVYDQFAHIFPVQTINALNQSIYTDYIDVFELNPVPKGLWGQVESTTDSNNQTAYFQYDTFGRPIATISPLDSVAYPTSQTVYEEFSTYTKITNKSRVEHGGAITIDAVQYFDGLGRLIQQKSVAGNNIDGSATIQYIVSGQQEYNNRGLVVKSYPSRFTSNDINTLDNIDVTQPFTQTIYDAMGRVVRVNGADGTTSNVGFDRWMTVTTDANGHVQKSYSDAFGRLIKKEEYLGADGRAADYPASAYTLYATTTYTYDALGNLIFVTDAHNNVTTIEYDRLGRKVAMDDPDMGHWTYIYDMVGNLSRQTDAKGKMIEFNYDALNRLVMKYDYVPPGTLIPCGENAVCPSPTTTINILARYTYGNDPALNNVGRLVQVEYENDSTTFSYDAQGREVSSTKTIDGNSYTVNRTYNALNQLKQVQYPSGNVLLNGQKVNYQYNRAGQIDAVLDEGGSISRNMWMASNDAKTNTLSIPGIGLAYGDEEDIPIPLTPMVLSTYTYVNQAHYNAQGQIIQLDYGNGVTTSYTYDNNNKRLKRIYTSNNQAQKLQDLNYTYDALGQITAITDALNTASQTFKYDALNRLTYASGAYGSKTYAYDEIGNLKSKDGITYTYGQGAGPHAVTSLSDGTSFTYDLNGNMSTITKGNEVTTYGYDTQNRLNSVTSKTGSDPAVLIAQYGYDGDGGRVKKVVYRRDKAVYNNKSQSLLFETMYGLTKPATATNPKIVTTRYVGQIYEEESIEGETNARRTKFIYLGSQRLASNNNGEAMWYHADHLGGTNVLSDRQGQARELTEYEPFGSIQRHEKYGDYSSTAWYYFTGKPIDDETGLMYYGARYYNPKLGRFITPDTIVQSPGNPQTLNRYTYCNNNPVNLIDPSGHSWFKKLIGKVSGYMGFAGTLLNNLVTGDWSQIGRQLAVFAISAATSFLLPGFGTLSSNLFINIGAHALIGAAQGAVIGGISSMIMGGTFAQGARTGAFGGAIGGGLQGFTTSEQFKNWKNGDGFRNNAEVRLNKANAESKTLTVDQTRSGDPILDDPKVKAAMDKAWAESLDGQDQVVEQGGWIIKDKRGNYSVKRWPQGESGSIEVPKMPKRAVGEFHTHPYSSSEQFFHSPSAADYDSTRSDIYGLSHYIIDRQGVMSYQSTNGPEWGVGTFSDYKGE